MANALTPSQQQVLAAAAGNSQLLELLESILNTQQATQQVTNTTGKNVPPQARATVSYLQGSYEVQIVNPGASSPLSQLQAAQQSQGATQATTLQAVTPILHQIRCATSAAFGVNDNVQIFGGNSGSTQTSWTLTGLGSGNFYFQVRSSYDGVNFNQWKNANGGQSITSFPEEVTVEQTTNADWGVFTLPGNQLIAVGEGFVDDENSFGLPSTLYSSAMIAIAGPNGYADAGKHVADIVNCDVTINVPQNTSGTVGIPDYPTLVLMKYGDGSTPQNVWSGSANVFAIAYDPAGANVTQYPSADGLSNWAVFTLPGGAQLAIGQGLTENGAAIEVPAALPWVSFANLLSICSPHGDEAGHSAAGISVCQLTTNGAQIIANCEYADNSGNTWPGHANWLAVSWTPGLSTASVLGGNFVMIRLAGGNVLAFGAGQVASGTPFALPAGFSIENMLSIATPGSFTGSGSNNMHGVAQCEVVGTTPLLSYTDGSGNSWSGNVNWMCFAWADLS